MSPSTARNVRLLLELGRGGMGIVYLALQQGPAGFARLKVVKRLRPDLAGEPAAVTMFLEEGRISARLHHASIVQTNEVGFDGEHYFLEMEYLDGATFEALTARAAKAGGLAIPLAVLVLGRVLGALHYAHELTDLQGAPLRLVHRDVSPHNVFVTYDGEVKLLDFGIAKAADSQSETQTGVVKGKVTYMAPEQVAKKPLDRRADLFSVGVMLWEALAGERLWKDKDGFEIFLALRSEPIPAPSSVRPVDEALERICMRALARDRADRFATAAEMQSALDAWAQANGPRVGARELSEAMDAVLGEVRAAQKVAIDAAIRATPAEGSALVPMLRQGAPITGTQGATSSTLGAGTRVRQARELRGMRALALASVAIALVASVSATTVMLRSRAAARPRASVTTASADAAVAGACARNAACAEGEICSAARHVCVALATDRCKVLAGPGDVANDRTIWIGAMFPTTGPEAEVVGVPGTNAVELARRDFAEIAGGIPSHGADPARPLGIVACDDAEDETRSALHLADDVGVPAVLGFRSSAESIALAREVFVPRGVLVASIDPSAQVTQVLQPRDGPRLVWRTTPATTLVATPAARVVSDLLEPRLRAAGLVGDRTPMRVAIVRPKTQYGASIAEALTGALVLNGRPALANAADFEQIVFDDPRAAEAHPDYAAVARRLIERAPHAILYAGEDELVANVFEPVERGWTARDHRPVWISVTNLEGGPLFAFVGKNADRRRRFFGVSSPQDTPANAQLAVHYSSEFTKVSTNDTPAAQYDAAYLVAMAAYVAGDGALTGRALASAIARLVPPGTKIDVGPTHILEGIDALRRGQAIDLVGADTTLDFDLATGEPTVDWVVQCVGVDAEGAANDAIESGVTFDPRAGKLVGALHCP